MTSRRARGAFPFTLLVAGAWLPGAGRVDNVDYPGGRVACNCGQCGQPKNQLSTMSTLFWFELAAGAEI